jgi:hypothetical protein
MRYPFMVARWFVAGIGPAPVCRVTTCLPTSFFIATCLLTTIVGAADPAAAAVKSAAAKTAVAEKPAVAPEVGPSDLFEVVPADVGLTVEARDLHSTLTNFVDGPVFRRWKQYPPLAKWSTDQESQIKKLSQQLKRQLGVSWEDLRSRLFSRQWVLGIYPPRAGDRDPDGFLLVRAADADLLAQAAGKLFDAQRVEGKYLGSSTVKFGDKSFTIHELKAEQDHSIFLTYDGVFGALAVRRETLDRVLKLAAGVDTSTPTLADDETYRSAMQRVSPEAVLRSYARPRAWIPQAYSNSSDSSESAVTMSTEQKLVLDVIRATNYVVAAVDLKETPRLEVHVGWESARLPEMVREVVVGLRGEGPSSAASVPADALLALASSIDAKRLTEALTKAATDEAVRRSESLPMEALIGLRLLGSLGPRGMLYVTPPRAADPPRARLMPVDWVVGVDTQSIGVGPIALVDTLDPLLRTIMSLAADVLNSRGIGRAKIETIIADPLTVTGLTGLGPNADGGVFVARQSGRLWCGSSPASLVDGATLGPKSSLEADPQYQRVRNPRFESPDHFVYLNLVALRGLLDQLADVSPAWVPAEKSEQFTGGMRETRKLLSLVDGVLVEAEFTTGGAAVSIAVAVDEKK